MVESPLRNRRILVVEDEYMLADELRSKLSDVAAEVLGPVPSVEQAIDILGQEDVVDGAILDVNLGGELAYPVADRLMERGAPFVFATGYDLLDMPDRFARITRCEKPVELAVVVRELGHLLTDKRSFQG